MKAKLGIFTPYGLALCYKCHGNSFPRQTLSVEEFEKMEESVHLRNGNYYTKCDKCKNFIQTTDSIANEKNLTYELREMGYDANFAQTGSMNSAVLLDIIIDNQTVDDEYPPQYYVTYNFEGDSKWWITGYKNGDDMIDGTEFSFKTYEEMLEHIKTIKNITKR